MTLVEISMINKISSFFFISDYMTHGEGGWVDFQLENETKSSSTNKSLKKAHVAGMTKEKLLKGTVVEYSFREVRARRPRFREV